MMISIRPQPAAEALFTGGEDTITAGTKPATSPRRPSRYDLRQVNNS
jgi:hypothetical protein